MMINLELTLAKYIIIALLIVIAVLILVIFAQSRQINKMLDESLQEKKNKNDFDENWISYLKTNSMQKFYKNDQTDDDRKMKNSVLKCWKAHESWLPMGVGIFYNLINI